MLKRKTISFPLLFAFSFVLNVSSVQYSIAGIVISVEHNKSIDTTIYQKGIAVFIKNGKAESIIDTNTNNCIAINHRLKRYIFLKCDKFKSVITKLTLHKVNQQKSMAVQEMMVGNQPPKTPITVKRSGRGSYQGFHVEKFQFIVDGEVVSEYWLSGILNEKITKEIDLDKIDVIYHNIEHSNFEDGLNAKIKTKYKNFRKKRFALKEFRYTGSETKKIYRHVTMKRVKIRKYMPPRSYRISFSVKDFFKEES